MTKRTAQPAPKKEPENLVEIKKRSETHDTFSRDIVKKEKRDGQLAYLVNYKSVEKRFEPGPGDGAAPGKSNMSAEDQFDTMAAEGRIVEPPFDLFALSHLPEQSSELGQCIDAMVANIDQLGHRQVPRVKLDDPSVVIPDNLRLEIETEQVYLSNFFEYCTSESFTEFRTKQRKDKETTGNAFFEVIRDASGKVQQFIHLPSYQMRLARLDDEMIKVDRAIMRQKVEDFSVDIETVQEWKRFRRFVQGRSFSARGNVSTSTKLTWFKSFGDPRNMDKNTGMYETPETINTAAVVVKKEDYATEVVHTSLYCARSPYGLPRYVGNLLSIYGDRAAEEINFTTFKNNNIPSMMILVSGGELTQGSVDRLTSFAESGIQSSDNRSKFIVLEAESVSDEGEDQGQARITIERMSKDQHNDALFQKYSENNQDKIRRVFRLPPLLVGRADDYTRTTAETSKRIADEQVFTPERNEFDNLFNRIIYPVMGIRYHKFKSNTPSTTDNETLINILGNAEKTGGVTPKIARGILEQVLSQDLGGFPKDFKSDVPFSATMAEAVKNKGDAAEPGQQVTALKRLLLATLLGDEPGEVPEGEDPGTWVIKRMNERIESSWQQEVTGKK